jgi:YVTN family beta-propeller protein
MSKIMKTASIFVLSALLAACSSMENLNQERTDTDRSAIVPSIPTVTSSQGFVYTANENDNSISAVDVGAGRVKNIATDITPHNIQISSDGKTLFAVGPAAHAVAHQSSAKTPTSRKKARGKLLIIDAETLAPEKTAEIEIGHHPAHVIVDWQDRFAYTTNSDDNTVVVIDVPRKKVIAAIKTGAFPHGLRMSPSGHEIYVANVKDGSVSVIDTQLSREVARILTGKTPVQVAFTPNGRHVYVTLRDENKVAVIDTASRKTLATIAVGLKPIQIYVSPNGKYAYVANQGTATEPDNTVSVIDTHKNIVIATITTGKGAHGVVLSDDGKRAYISNIADNTVSIIDTAHNRVIGNINVGKGPNGITFRRTNQ